MPRYVFSIANGSASAADTREADLPTLDDARKYALRTIGGILFDETLMGRDDIAVSVHIDDEQGERLASVTSSTRIAFSPQ
jgi:hypothetical protein